MMIIILATYLLVSNAFGQEVYETLNDLDPSNFKNNATVTPLHPIVNTTALPPPQSTTQPVGRNPVKHTKGNNTVSDESTKERKSFKNDATSWKIDATYSDPKTEASREVDTNITKSRNLDQNEKENDVPFKPSPALESYYDLDDFGSPPAKTYYKDFSPIVKDDFRGIVKFEEDSKNFSDGKKLQHSKDGLRNEGHFPYKFEKHNPKGFQKFRYTQPDSKPTAPVPVSIPAGGLYKIPYALHNEKPDSYERDKEFDLFHDDGLRDHKLKKTSNPWKGLIHLMTALLPVGLIVSALSPNIVTIESTQCRSKICKRSTGAAAPPLPAPLEACRRRIMCELYQRPQQLPHQPSLSSRPERRIEPLEEQNCSEHLCEDPRVMTELVRWVRRQLRPRKTKASRTREAGDENTLPG